MTESKILSTEHAVAVHLEEDPHRTIIRGEQLKRAGFTCLAMVERSQFRPRSAFWTPTHLIDASARIIVDHIVGATEAYRSKDTRPPSVYRVQMLDLSVFTDALGFEPVVSADHSDLGIYTKEDAPRIMAARTILNFIKSISGK